MANIGSWGTLKHIDDPQVSIVVVDTPAAGVTWATENDSGTDILRGVAAGKGLHYTGATASSTGDLTEFCSNDLLFTGQEGYSAVEILVQFSTVSAMAFNFGFNDDVLDAANTLPAELSGTSWTSNAATFVGFAFDTDATNDDLHCFWVNANTDSATAIANLRMIGLGLTASKWLYLKVEMQDMGSGEGARVTFSASNHSGRSLEKVFNTTVSRSTPLCYYLGVESRGTASSIYLRNCNWEQSIPNM